MAISLPIPPVAVVNAPLATTAPVKEESKLTISVGGKELIPPAVALLAPIFETDPLITYFLNGLTREQRNAYLPKYFTALLTAAGMNKASFYHTDVDTVTNAGTASKDDKVAKTAPEWRSSVVLIHPGESIDNPLTLLPSGLPSVIVKLGLAGVRKMLFEFEGACKAARKAGLRKNEEPYYVFFVGTAVEHQGRGLGGEIVKETMRRAASEGRTVWLEATTEGSRRLYARLGFELVREIVLGEGRVGKEGLVEKGGEGVRIWAMVWRPVGMGVVEEKKLVV